MLCGLPGEHEGNPLSVAASKSVVLFNETLKTLEVRLYMCTAYGDHSRVGLCWPFNVTLIENANNNRL